MRKVARIIALIAMIAIANYLGLLKFSKVHYIARQQSISALIPTFTTLCFVHGVQLQRWASMKTSSSIHE